MSWNERNASVGIDDLAVSRIEGLTVRLAGVLRSALPFLVVLGIWWVVWRAQKPSPSVLVPPSEVFNSLVTLAREGVLGAYVARSLGRLGTGILISVFVGVPLGWLLGLSGRFAQIVEPGLRFFMAISGITWLPLMILWFGISEQTIVVITVYTMFFPLVFSAFVGVRTIPKRLIDSCETLGASSLRIVKDVYLPGSFPSLVTGLRLGIGYGWRALIAGEFVVGQGGLGFMIFDARRQGVIGTVMAGMIFLGILWLLMERLILRPIEADTTQRWGLSSL